MDLRQLRYFVVLAEELHFGRAAARLEITQPALSQAVTRLERELGVTLFHRTSRGVVLAAAGQAFLEPARLVLLSAERAIAVGQGLSVFVPSELTLVVSTIARFTTTSAILAAQLRTSTPELELHVHEAAEPDAVAAVVDGRADALLAIAPTLPPRFETFELRREPAVAIVGSSNPLAAVSEVRLERLAAEPLVIWSPEAAPGAYETVMTAFGSRGLRPSRVEHRAAGADWEEEFAAFGFALVPRSFPVFTGTVHVRIAESLVFSEVIAWPAEAGAQPAISALRWVAGLCAEVRGWSGGTPR